MSERYIKQFEFKNSVFLEDCPIALEKGAVLLDTKTNTYVLQLKLANIGAESMQSAQISVKISVVGIDGKGNLAYPGVSRISAQYNNELADIGDAFGTKTLIPVPNNNATAFRVYVEEVAVFEDILTYVHEQYITETDARDFEAKREQASQQHKIELEKRAQLDKLIKKKAINRSIFYLCILFTSAGIFWFGAADVGRSYLISFSGVIAFAITAILCSVFSKLKFGTFAFQKALHNRQLAHSYKLLVNRRKTYTQIAQQNFMQTQAYEALMFAFLAAFPLLILALQPFEERNMRAFSLLLYAMILVVILWLPFLRMFSNARKADNTLTLSQVLGIKKANTVESNISHNYAQNIEQFGANMDNDKISIQDAPQILCQKCGENLGQNASFCSNCGEKFIAEEKAKPVPEQKLAVFCELCGEEITPGARFCKFCGGKQSG